MPGSAHGGRAQKKTYRMQKNLYTQWNHRTS